MLLCLCNVVHDWAQGHTLSQWPSSFYCSVSGSICLRIVNIIIQRAIPLLSYKHSCTVSDNTYWWHKPQNNLFFFLFRCRWSNSNIIRVLPPVAFKPQANQSKVPSCLSWAPRRSTILSSYIWLYLLIMPVLQMKCSATNNSTYSNLFIMRKQALLLQILLIQTNISYDDCENSQLQVCWGEGVCFCKMLCFQNSKKEKKNLFLCMTGLS